MLLSQQTHVLAAGPSITLIRLSTPTSLNIFAVASRTSLRLSSVTISALVTRVPSYQAKAEKPVKVPTSSTARERADCQLYVPCALFYDIFLFRCRLEMRNKIRISISFRSEELTGPDHPLAPAISRTNHLRV